MNAHAQERRKGHSVVEVTLMAPWVFLLFAGVMDMGFYSVALMAVDNAARVAVNYTSGSSAASTDAATACQYVLTELRPMENARTLTACTQLPVVVTAALITGVDGAPASRVAVQYRTVPMFPLPGLAGQFTITRTAEMRIRE